MQSATPVIDAQIYRTVMGLWPTGVSVVSGLNEEGEALGMVIGSLTSVSINPPLVAFCPQKSSASWQEMRKTQRVAINFLTEFQPQLCGRFATGPLKGRFEGVDCAPNPYGVPRLAGCAAWVDVVIDQEIEAGDHWIVVCRVEAMEKGECEAPMTFAKGKLGKSAPLPQLGENHLGDWERAIQLMSLSY